MMPLRRFAAFASLVAIAVAPGPALADVAPSLTPMQQAVTLFIPIHYSFIAPIGWQNAFDPNAKATSFVATDNNRHVLTFGGLAAARATDLEARATTMMDDARHRGATVVDDGAGTVCGTRPTHRWTVSDVEGGAPTVAHLVMEPVAAGLAVVTYAHPAADQDRPDAISFLRDFCASDTPLSAPAYVSARPSSAQPSSAQPAGSTPLDPKGWVIPLAGPIGFTAAGPTGWPRIPSRMGVQFQVVDPTGGPQEFLISGGFSNTMDPAGQARLRMDTARKTGIAVVDDGAGAMCNGRPSYHWTERHTLYGLPMVFHMAIAIAMPGYGFASYIHLDTTPDRPDAVSALQAFCPTMATMTPLTAPTGPVATPPAQPRPQR
jgi:hypothetical protein